MARLRTERAFSLWEFVEGLSLLGFARLLFCLLCAFVARVMNWCCEACGVDFVGVETGAGECESLDRVDVVESKSRRGSHSPGAAQMNTLRRQRVYAVRRGQIALSFVPFVVVLWLLFMATTVTAQLLANESRLVSSAVQEPLSTEEVAGIREIARNVVLLSKNWSWLKAGLLSIGGLLVVGVLIEILKIFTGSYTQCRVDRRREAMPQGNQVAASANQMADPGAQQAASSNRTATITADADREGIQMERLEELLRDSVVDPNRRDNPSHFPSFETEASGEGEGSTRGHHCCSSIEDVSRTASRFPE